MADFNREELMYVLGSALVGGIIGYIVASLQIESDNFSKWMSDYMGNHKDATPDAAKKAVMSRINMLGIGLGLVGGGLIGWGAYRYKLSNTAAGYRMAVRSASSSGSLSSAGSGSSRLWRR